VTRRPIPTDSGRSRDGERWEKKEPAHGQGVQLEPEREPERLPEILRAPLPQASGARQASKGPRRCELDRDRRRRVSYFASPRSLSC
jgi:hypothetical protein